MRYLYLHVVFVYTNYTVYVGKVRTTYDTCNTDSLYCAALTLHLSFEDRQYTHNIIQIRVCWYYHVHGVQYVRYMHTAVNVCRITPYTNGGIIALCNNRIMFVMISRNAYRCWRCIPVTCFILCRKGIYYVVAFILFQHVYTVSHIVLYKFNAYVLTSRIHRYGYMLYVFYKVRVWCTFPAV
jgi:hypothetical protein